MARGTFIYDIDKIQIKLIWEKLKRTKERVSAADVRKEALRVTGRSYGRSTVHTIMAIEPEEGKQFIYFDHIWTVGISSDLITPMPPDIIPLLIKVQYDKELANGRMTIREAWWVNNLSVFFSVKTADPNNRQLRDLWIVAQLYAAFDRASEDCQVFCDTDVLDAPNPVEMKAKALKWFKGKITDELYQELNKGDGK